MLVIPGELRDIVSEIVKAHCDQEGVSWREGRAFLDEIYDEATRDGAISPLFRDFQ